MFSVIFEVNPHADKWDDYLRLAKLLKPELERIDGFIDNVRYGSLRRQGWLLSLSTWRDEKAVVRWRTQATHHGVQEKGRFGVFQDYHLRVGQVTADNQVPPGHELREQRLDVTEIGESKAVTLVEAKRPADLPDDALADTVAQRLGLVAAAQGLVAWDVFDAILSPGDLTLLLSWVDDAAAQLGESAMALPAGARLRRVRVVRDYGMFDRREAAQYYAEVERRRS